jgi:UDP-glucose 4-epimerase
MKVLITGSEGLIGRELQRQLKAINIAYLRYDKCIPRKQPGYGNILNKTLLQSSIEKCNGIVHLAAVSRVIWGERDPKACWETNVNGTQNVLDIAANCAHKPWVIYASSREVYGQPATLPATEDTPLNAVNHYAKAKVAAENLVNSYKEQGLNTVILRFSNVYGDIIDHSDRVVPAFCLAAALGGKINIEGKDNLFDFTHVTDVVRGLIATIKCLAADSHLPPIHFTSGKATSLLELAELANEMGGGLADIVYKPPRNFDVAQFYGIPSRAYQLLNWQHTTPLVLGLNQLINTYRQTSVPKKYLTSVLEIV